MQCCNNQQQQQQPGGTGSFTPQATTFVATYAAYLHTYIQIQIQIQIQIRKKKKFHSTSSKLHRQIQTPLNCIFRNGHCVPSFFQCFNQLEEESLIFQE